MAAPRPNATLLQTVQICARVGADSFFLTAGGGEKNCSSGHAGFQEAIEVVLTQKGIVLRSFVKPHQFLGTRGTWISCEADAAAWLLARPPSPLEGAFTLAVAGAGLFLAFDAGSARFRMSKGFHAESILVLQPVTESQRNTWGMARALRSATISGPTPEQARVLLVEAFIQTELDYADILDELETRYVEGLSDELTAHEIQVVFSNLSAITKFQTDFCHVLRDKEGKDLPIAHMFLKILPRLESLYFEFALGQPAAREVLRRKQEDPDFVDSLREQEKGSKKTLSQMLDMVATRLVHYRDQFGAIAGCTGSELSSYPATMEAMAAFQRITNALNEKLQAQEGEADNALLAEQIEVLPEHDPGKGFKLNDGKRSIQRRAEVEMWPLVKMRSTFTRKGSKRLPKSIDSRRATLLLLDDALVFVETAAAGSSKQYATCARVLLLNTIASSLHDGHFHVVHNKRELYDFKVVDSAQQQALTTALDVFQEDE